MRKSFAETRHTLRWFTTFPVQSEKREPLLDCIIILGGLPKRLSVQ